MSGHDSNHSIRYGPQIRERPVQIRPRLLNINETAKYLGIAPKTLRNRLGPSAPNPFPVKPKRIGKRVLFDVKALDAFVDGLDAH
jgi:hypothetical protein